MPRTAPAYFSVKNFEKYQHYRDRRPPWIKVYYALLDDYEFMMLSEVQQCRYLKLMLVASQCDNRIANDSNYIRTVLRVIGDVDLRPLFAAGFLVPWTSQGNIKVHNWASRYVSEETRAKVLSTGKCVECGLDSDLAALEVDHIIPISQGGTQEISNLQAMCRTCNRRKHNKVRARQMLDSSDSGSSQVQVVESESESESERETETEKNKSWLDALRANPAYRHINFEVEFGKMDAWFSMPSHKNRKRTPKFILAWLNKIDAPVDTKPQLKAVLSPVQRQKSAEDEERRKQELERTPISPVIASVIQTLAGKLGSPPGKAKESEEGT